MTPILIKGALYQCNTGIYYQYKGIIVSGGVQFMKFRELLQENYQNIPVTTRGLAQIERGLITCNTSP